MTVSVDTVSVTLGIETRVAEKSASEFPANILAGTPISFFVKPLVRQNPLVDTISKIGIVIEDGDYNSSSNFLSDSLQLITNNTLNVTEVLSSKLNIKTEKNDVYALPDINSSELSILVNDTTQIKTVEIPTNLNHIEIKDESTFDFLGPSVNVNYPLSYLEQYVEDATSGNSGGNAEFTTPGTYSWTCPSGVSSVSVVCVGAGGTGGYQWSSGGGGGGGLGWKNNIPVTAGQSYTVVVGDHGTVLTTNATNAAAMGNNSYFIDVNTVCGFGAGRGGTDSTGSGNGGYGGGYTGDGGGRGGNGGYEGSWNRAGGGAGGYSGRGGDGGVNSSSGEAGQGGGGGAGGWYSSTWGTPGGGGVGIYGEGTSGGTVSSNGEGGKGGSGGEDGHPGEPITNNSISSGDIVGGNYGGGGGGSGTSAGGGPGGTGAVRIVWGTNVAFPTTNVEKIPTAGFNLTSLYGTQHTFSNPLTSMDALTDTISNLRIPTNKLYSSTGYSNPKSVAILSNSNSISVESVETEKLIMTNRNDEYFSVSSHIPSSIGFLIKETENSIEYKFPRKIIKTETDKSGTSPLESSAQQINFITYNFADIGYFDKDGRKSFEQLTDENDPRIVTDTGDTGDTGGTGGTGGTGSGPIQSWSS
jgi:hypothetical protein